MPKQHGKPLQDLPGRAPVWFWHRCGLLESGAGISCALFFFSPVCVCVRVCVRVIIVWCWVSVCVKCLLHQMSAATLRNSLERLKIAGGGCRGNLGTPNVTSIRLTDWFEFIVLVWCLFVSLFFLFHLYVFCLVLFTQSKFIACERTYKKPILIPIRNVKLRTFGFRTADVGDGEDSDA